MFVCGGTAGHINPALAAAAALRKRAPGAEIMFVGSGRELEKRLIPQAGYELVNIRMTGIVRGLSLKSISGNLRTAVNLVSASRNARKLIKGFKPDAVLGTGGHICYPVLGSAGRMGVPTLIHESNAVPGLTTRKLSKSASNVLTAFPESEGLYGRPERVIFTGTPVRDGFLSPHGSRAGRKSGEKPLLISFWGSLGAERMNEAMAGFFNSNLRDGRFRHIHATGKGGVEKLKKSLLELGAHPELPPGLEIREYIEEMPALMAEADLVLCRAGASTIAELTALGKPAVLIPSPNVVDDHQTPNALRLQKRGGAVVLDESECTGDVLYNSVLGIITDEARLAGMSEAQRALGAPDAAERIAGIIIDIAGGNAK